jgi:hypothetical protein
VSGVISILSVGPMVGWSGNHCGFLTVDAIARRRWAVSTFFHLSPSALLFPPVPPDLCPARPAWRLLTSPLSIDRPDRRFPA